MQLVYCKFQEMVRLNFDSLLTQSVAETMCSGVLDMVGQSLVDSKSFGALKIHNVILDNL